MLCYGNKGSQKGRLSGLRSSDLPQDVFPFIFNLHRSGDNELTILSNSLQKAKREQKNEEELYENNDPVFQLTRPRHSLTLVWKACLFTRNGEGKQALPFLVEALKKNPFAVKNFYWAFLSSEVKRKELGFYHEFSTLSGFKEYLNFKKAPDALKLRQRRLQNDYKDNEESDDISSIQSILGNVKAKKGEWLLLDLPHAQLVNYMEAQLKKYEHQNISYVSFEGILVLLFWM